MRKERGAVLTEDILHISKQGAALLLPLTNKSFSRFIFLFFYSETDQLKFFLRLFWARSERLWENRRDGWMLDSLFSCQLHETMPKVWGPCQRHGDHANSMGTMPMAWGPCQRHGDHAKGMGTMPKAWGPCQKHGDHANGMGTMPKVTKGMGTLPKAWRPCQSHEDHAEGMGIMPKAWRSCQRHGYHVKGMGTILRAWGPC